MGSAFKYRPLGAFRTWVLLALLVGSCTPQGAQPTSPPPTSPVVFEPNGGQTDSSVQFTGKSAGYDLYFTGTELVFQIMLPAGLGGLVDSFLATADNMTTPPPGTVAGVTVALLKANTSPKATGLDQLPGISNYLFGSDSSKWATNVKKYAKLSYTNVYDGIDMLFYGVGDVIEHDFIVHPGTDPSVIKMGIGGAKSISVKDNGDLDILVADGSDLILKNPKAYYQDDSAKTPLAGFGYQILDPDLKIVGLTIGDYDHNRTLIIDPVAAALTYSTFLGGTFDDITWGIAVDSSGNSYTVGYTKSTNFPTNGTAISSFAGTANVNFHAFVTKISAAGANTWTTYIGGSSNDFANSVAVDSSGNVYVTGYTTSTDYPTTSGVLHTSNAGGYDAFLSKLNSTGSALTYSTYIGGSGFDRGSQIALDTVSTNCTTGGQPCVILAGTTASTDLATASNLSTSGVVQTSNGGGAADAFVAHISATGVATNSFMTYLGGTGRDVATGVALDAYGDVFVSGENRLGGFPTTSGVISTSFNGVEDAFVTKLTPDFALKIYSTYVGGSGKDGSAGIAVNKSGNAYIVGTTASSVASPFTPVNAYQGSLSGSSDIYVAELNTGGTAFNFLTYLGGTGAEFALGFQSIAIDDYGRMWVTGQTTSGSSFFNTNPISGHGNLVTATSNGFVAQLDSPFTAAPAMPFSTYLGGSTASKNDIGVGIALDSAGLNGYVTGMASTSNFETTSAGIQRCINNTGTFGSCTTNPGYSDGFLSQVRGSLYLDKDSGTGCPTPVGDCISGYTVGGLQILVLRKNAAYSAGAAVLSTITTPANYTLVSGGALGNLTSGYREVLSQIFPSATVWTMQSTSQPDYPTTSAGSVDMYSVVISYNGAALDPADYTIVATSSPATGLDTLTTGVTLSDSYTLVGGGAKVTTNGDGHWIVSSYPSTMGVAGAWSAKSKAHFRTDTTSTLTAYAIGISNSFLSKHGLSVTYAASTTTASLGAIGQTCTVPSGSKVIGGGAQVGYTLYGKMLFGSYPLNNVEWQAGATDLGTPVDAVTSITTYCIGISSSLANGCPQDSTINGCIRGYQVGGLEILALMQNSASNPSTSPTKTISLPTPAGISPNTYRAGSVGGVTSNANVFFTKLAPDPQTVSPTLMNPTGAIASASGSSNGTDSRSGIMNAYSMIFRYNGAPISGPTTNCGTEGNYTICVGTASSSGNNVTATAQVPTGYTLIGGGAYDNMTPGGANGEVGHFLYASYPSDTLDNGTWTVSGKDNPSLTRITGVVTAYAIGIKNTWLTANNLTVSLFTSTTSPGADSLTATASTTGRKVLIGGGAKIVVGGNGHWLYQTYPSSSTEWTAKTSAAWTPDLLSSLTTYAIGISSP